LGTTENDCTSCHPGVIFENGTGPGKCGRVHPEATGVQCTLGDYVLLNGYKCISDEQYNQCEYEKG